MVCYIIAFVAFVSLIINYLVYRRVIQATTKAEVIRLHSIWWSPRMKEIREEVIQYVRQWEQKGTPVDTIRELYESNSPTLISQRYAIGQIAYFFADLNAMIDEGLINEKFAYRIFGDSQFFWFSPFLLKIIEITKHQNENDVYQRNIRWHHEVLELERKFRDFQHN